MKKYSICIVALALLCTSCQGNQTPEKESTMNSSETTIIKSTEFTRRSIPEIEPPEIKGNQKKLSTALHIKKDSALKLAKTLYTFNISELAEVKVTDKSDSDFWIQVTDISQDIYRLRFSLAGDIQVICKEGVEAPMYEKIKIRNGFGHLSDEELKSQLNSVIDEPPFN